MLSIVRLTLLLCLIAPIFAQDGTTKVTKNDNVKDNNIETSLSRSFRGLRPILLPSLKFKAIRLPGLRFRSSISLPNERDLAKVVSLGVRTYLAASRVVGKLILSSAFFLTGIASRVPRVIREQLEVIVGMVALSGFPILGFAGLHFIPFPIVIGMPMVPQILRGKLPKPIIIPKKKTILPSLVPKIKTIPRIKVKPKIKPILPSLVPKVPKLKLKPKLLPKLPKPILPKLPMLKLKSILKLRPRIVLEPGFIFPRLRLRLKKKIKIIPEFKPNLDLFKFGVPGVSLAPGISKAQLKEFSEQFMTAILPPGTKNEVRDMLGQILAPHFAKSVPKVLKFMQLPGPVQQALALPFQFAKGGKKISSLNLGNRPHFEWDFHRDARSLRVRRKSDQEMIKFILDQLFNLAQQSTNNQKLSSIQETFTALGINGVIPIANVFSHLPPVIQRILQLPFHIDRIIPKISVDSAQWRIQALPVRIIQAVFPLLSSGDVSVFLVLKSLIPLPIRLILAVLPIPSGKYKFPRKFAGLLPDKALPKLQIQLPDGEFEVLSKIIPYLLHLPEIQIPDKIYDKIEDNLPNKIKYIKKKWELPTIHITPFSIFGLFPEYSVKGGKNQKLKTAMQLLELTGPIVFITIFLNPLNIPGAILSAALLSIPALIQLDPLRWLDPAILFGTKKGTGKGSII